MWNNQWCSQKLLDFSQQLKSKDNPIKRKKDKLYVKYDGFEIANSADGCGLEIRYKWQGVTMVTMAMPNVRLENHITVNVMAVHGKLPCTIGDS